MFVVCLKTDMYIPPFGGSAAVTGRADPGFDVPGLHWAGLGSTALLSKASYGGTAGRRLGCWDVVEAHDIILQNVLPFFPVKS